MLPRCPAELVFDRNVSPTEPRAERRVVSIKSRVAGAHCEAEAPDALLIQLIVLTTLDNDNS
jgi:hypothetical protein